MNKTRWWRSAALAAVLVAAALGWGCFDYSVELALNEAGHGNVEVGLSLPEKLAQGHEMGRLDTLVFPIPVRERQVRDGLLVLSERSGFQNLDDLAARRVRFEVEEVGTGVLGLSAYTYRVTTYMEMVEGDLPDRLVLPGTELESHAPGPGPLDPTQQRLRQLRARTLAGHYLTLSLRFPGRAEVARPLVLGSSEIKPEVDAQGGRVSWKVPLSVLVNENVRRTLTFSADFKGKFVFRGYVQQKAQSHYPDAFDEALGRGENPGMSRGQYLKRLGLGGKAR